jgi:hypothetical protein
MILLKRWLSLKFPRHTRRRTGATERVESFDAKGKAVGESKSRAMDARARESDRGVLQPQIARR